VELKELTDQLEKVKGEIKNMVKDGDEAALKSLKDLENTIEAKIKEANEKLEAAQKSVNELNVRLDEADKKATEAEIERKRTRMDQEKAGKSFDVLLKEALVEKTDDIAKFAKKETKSLSIDLKAAGDITTANVTTGTRYGQLMRPGIIEIPKRKVHIRSLVPNGTVDPGNTLTFMREASTGEGAPAPVLEGAAKAQFDLDLEESNVGIETIAGHVRFTRKAMMNIAGFISFLQSRMPEKLLVVEDAQMLYGNGTSPNLKGILAAGNYTDATSTATVLVEQIIDSIADLEDSDTAPRTANGILLRPREYYNFFKNKATGSGEYDLPANVTFADGTLYISGVPVYASTALNATDYVVGDFQQGAQFLIQEGMRIEFFEQDADNVTKNKITARIEETVAFPVFGSNYFIKGTVPA
jgi:HK97 family phage major capsid protein